jgi:hypothetical protein
MGTIERRRWRWVLLLSAACLASTAAAAFLFAPGRVCKWQPLGDEGEGECLGFAARATQAGRCRVVKAVGDEIRGPNNDVVISSALEGFVAAGACADLALVWRDLLPDTPGHVYPLVATALAACIARVPFSAGGARSHPASAPSPQAIEAMTERSRCVEWPL